MELVMNRLAGYRSDAIKRLLRRVDDATFMDDEFSQETANAKYANDMFDSI